MENMRNKLIIAIIILTVVAVNFIFKGLNSNEGISHTVNAEQNIATVEQVDEFTPFVRPKTVEVKVQKEKAQSKFVKFQQKVANNQNVVPTRAHEFHNPNSTTLNNNKKSNTKAQNKAPQTDEEIEKAQKQAKEQAKFQNFLKESCGDIKDNEDKAYCHQAAANFYAEKKQKEANEKAKNDENEKNKDNVAPKPEKKAEVKDQPENNDSEENETEVIPQPTVSVTPQPQETNPTPSNENNEDKTKTLADWRVYLEDTNNETSMPARANELHGATIRAELNEQDFTTLIQEYFLDSNDESLESAGMKNLNKAATKERFQASVTFLSRNNVASSSEALTQYNENFRYFYLNDNRLNALNYFLTSFPLFVNAEEVQETSNRTDSSADFASTITTWSSQDPLFMTIELIKAYADNKFASLNNIAEDDEDTVNKALLTEGNIASLQLNLQAILDNKAVVSEVKEDTESALSSISQLLERIKSLKDQAVDTIEVADNNI